MAEGPPTPPTHPVRLASLYVIGALTIGAVGFFTGASGQAPSSVGYQPYPEVPAVPSPGGPGNPLAPPEAPVATAPSQSALQETRWGANANMYDGALAALAFPAARVVGPAAPRTEAARAAALQARAGRRAYEGAPPTIPHAIDQMQASSCLTCHERGMQLGRRIAPVMSHPRFESCTQCHVPTVSPFPLVDERGIENTFVGLAVVGPGDRAWPGAPPTMPHPSAMRDNCLSCHGTGGAVGLRTPHPERTSCLQCHPPGAVLDQRVAHNPSLEPGRPSKQP